MEKQLRLLNDKISSLKSNITTEEATKTSFILPLIQILGYDIFNPLELLPEAILDVGGKKGEKIDYIIYKDKNPILIIECKKWTEDLANHTNQLIRYFHTSKAKFGILTNGLIYQFFTDSEQPNIMDSTPFFIFDITNFSLADLATLLLFSKNKFNEKELITVIEELTYLSKVKNILVKELSNPSKEFSELIIRQIYTGRLTTKIFESFNSLVKKSLEDLFKTSIAEEDNIKVSKINTTDEELFLYQQILEVAPNFQNRLFYKDFAGHFSILLDNKPRQCICKALFNGKKKYIIFYNGDDEIKTEYFGNILEYTEIINSKINTYING